MKWPEINFIICIIHIIVIQIFQELEKTSKNKILSFLFLGITSSAQILGYPLVSELSPRILTATSVSVVSFTCIAGYAIFQPLFGRIMDWNAHQHLQVQSKVIYSLGDYHFAMGILPITFIIAFIATFFLKESYCQRSG
mgnify:CR=1 FL=1